MEEFREILTDIAKKDANELASSAMKAITEKAWNSAKKSTIDILLDNAYSYCSDGIAEWEKKLGIKRKGDIWK